MAEKPELERRIDALSAALPLFAQLRQAREALRQDRKSLAEAQRGKAAAGEEYARLFEEYLRDQAGVLAETLSMGQPCPVCGSTSHPRPAPHLERAPSRAEVDRAAGARDLADQTALKVAEAVSRSAQQAEALTRQLTERTGGADADREQACRDEVHALRAKAEALQRAFDRADEALRRAEQALSAAQTDDAR
ncbi:MAG: hypothetical protein IKD53_05670, partial [Clostridia bacterium]|nr:hypothetical protein [Clostridia bacterium]